MGFYKWIRLVVLVYAWSSYCSCYGARDNEFMKIKYAGKLINVYGYLNDDIVCVESGEREPGIIRLSELSDQDAFRIAKRARQSGFNYCTPEIAELTSKFVASNSVKVKVALEVKGKFPNYLEVYKWGSRKFDIKITKVFHAKHISPECIKIGCDLPRSYELSVGNLLNEESYFLPKQSAYPISVCVDDIDDAVKLIAGWMCVHRDDYYVQNILMGIHPQPISRQEKTQQIDVQVESSNEADVGRIAKTGVKEEPDAETYEKRVKRWLYKNLSSYSLSQYDGQAQKVLRYQLNALATTIAGVSVAYPGALSRDQQRRLIYEVNSYYSSKAATFWSRMEHVGIRKYEDMFRSILKELQDVIERKGDRFNLKEQCDKLYLRVCCGVNSWEELSAKIAAEKAMEEKREKERLFMQEERRIQAEREKADAIRNQSVDVYHHW